MEAFIDTQSLIKLQMYIGGISLQFQKNYHDLSDSFVVVSSILRAKVIETLFDVMTSWNRTTCTLTYLHDLIDIACTIRVQ